MIVDMWICDFVWSDDLKLNLRLRRPESLTRVKLKETSHTRLEPLVHFDGYNDPICIYISFFHVDHSDLFSARPGHQFYPLHPDVFKTNEVKFSGYGIPAAKHRNDFWTIRYMDCYMSHLGNTQIIFSHVHRFLCICRAITRPILPIGTKT